jgi:hypothetical protein
MIFETNEQALFLVPMAISLGLGTLASSLVVLILVPVVFVIMDEVTEGATGEAKADLEFEPELGGAAHSREIQ